MLKSGKTYSDGFGVEQTVGGACADDNRWVWTYQGKWFRRLDGRQILYSSYRLCHFVAEPSPHDLDPETEKPADPATPHGAFGKVLTGAACGVCGRPWRRFRPYDERGGEANICFACGLKDERYPQPVQFDHYQKDSGTEGSLAAVLRAIEQELQARIGEGGRPFVDHPGVPDLLGDVNGLVEALNIVSRHRQRASKPLPGTRQPQELLDGEAVPTLENDRPEFDRESWTLRRFGRLKETAEVLRETGGRFIDPTTYAKMEGVSISEAREALKEAEAEGIMRRAYLVVPAGDVAPILADEEDLGKKVRLDEFGISGPHAEEVVYIPRTGNRLVYVPTGREQRREIAAPRRDASLTDDYFTRLMGQELDEPQPNSGDREETNERAWGPDDPIGKVPVREFRRLMGLDSPSLEQHLRKWLKGED